MRKIAAILTIIITFALLALPCLSANDTESPDIKIYVDGEKVESEKKTIIDNSRTLVPIRAVAEKAKIRVGWDGEKHKVSLKYYVTEVTLTIGSDIMTVYNSVIDRMESVKLDTVPRIIDGSTYITLRAALEACGAGVLWDADRQAIYIVSPDSMMNYRLETESLEKHLSDYAEYVEKKYGVSESGDEDSNNGENKDTDTGTQIPEDNTSKEPKDDTAEEPTDNTPEKDEDNTEQVPDTPLKTAKDYGLSFSGFRKMTDDSIKENEIFNVSGKVRSETPIVLVRCTVSDSDIDQVKEYSADDGKTACDIYAVFSKSVKLNKAGLGEHTFTVFACVEGGQEVAVFSYDYTVNPKKQGHVSPNPDGDYVGDEDDDGDDEDDEETPTLSYYGFRAMSSNKIAEGAPHGLYGTIRSNSPITKVRCMIVGTDMDYSINLGEINNITEYNVFTYFDKLIRFSEAGTGKNTFKIYAQAKGTDEILLFSYTYTVTKKTDDDDEPSNDREKVDVTAPEFPGDVCLPLKGNIRLTSPYGFRAYNKWEFHKGIDIVSDAGLDIICVADGIVVDCAMGINSGAGNYVAIQHDEGWVSLYYHLKSYNVEEGDRVEMGEVIATMGNSGGNYGVHLHFMTCDDWYGGLWATQNNHHTAPHEYVPQILTGVKNYNPNYESENKDKIILCNFNFPNVLKEGTAYSISNTGGFAATEKGVSALTVVVTDKDGEVVIEETEQEPASTTDGYYTYTNISVKLDMKCRFDELSVGEYVFYVIGETEDGRERVIYTKAFEVVEDD